MKKSGPKKDIINSESYLKIQKEIGLYLRQGWSVYEIYATVLLDLPELIDNDFRRMVRRAYEHAKVTVHRNREFVFKEHMGRYERIYRKALEETQNLDPKRDWHIITGKYISAMKALRMREDLLGLHNKDLVIEISEDEALMKAKPTTKGRLPFRTDLLSLEEMIELVALLKAAKISEEDGVRKLIVKKYAPNLINQIPEPITDQAVDTIYEEMPAKVVDQLQTIVVSDERDKVAEQIKIIDKTGGLKPTGENFDSVKSKINANLLKQFELALKGKKQDG